MTSLDAETVAKMHELRAQGLSNQEIAQAAYVNRSTVYKYLGPAGHKLPTWPRQTNLARLRVAAGLTQKQLAERIGCDVNTLGGWERRQSSPRRYSIRRIAAALGCTEEEAAKDWREYDETAQDAP